MKRKEGIIVLGLGKVEGMRGGGGNLDLGW